MGGIVSGIFGGGSPSAPNIQVWQPQYTSQADTQAYNSITGINNNNPYAALQPQYAGVLSSAYNNPYAAPAQTAASSAGNQYATIGQQGATGAAALDSGAMSLLPYVSTVANTAMDPNSALYNQAKQQVTDQANVTNAQYGVTGPLAVGNTNQATTNFNIDWNAQKLANQIAGLNAAGSGVGAAASGLNSANALGSNAAGETSQSGTVPLAAYNTNLAALQSALNNYSTSQISGNQNTQTAVQDLLSYLGIGAQQSDAQAQATQQSYQDALTASNAQSQGLSSLFSGLIGAGTSAYNTLNPTSAISAGGSASQLGALIASMFI